MGEGNETLDRGQRRGRARRLGRRLAVGAVGAMVAAGAVPAVLPELVGLMPEGLRYGVGPAASFVPHNGIMTFLLIAALNLLAAIVCTQGARDKFLSPLTAAYAILLAAVSLLIAASEAFLVSVGEVATDPSVMMLFTEHNYRVSRIVLLAATVPLWWIALWAVWHRAQRRHEALPGAAGRA